MKKRVLYLLCMAFAMMAWLPPQLWAQTQPSGGDGSSESPFLIATAEELKWYANYVNGESGDNVVHTTACAKLMNDIDLSTVCGKGKGNWTPIAKYGIYTFNGEHRFDGVFDGNGYTISNLYINDKNGSNLGLFGYVTPTTKKTSVKNLKMASVQIVGKTDIAAVCTSGYNATFENIEVISGSIAGLSDIYGISGCRGSAKNCINRADVTASRYNVAGVISTIQDEASNCSNYGKITTGTGWAGGIAGGSDGFTTIQNCANYGEIHVTGTVNSTDYAVGGLLGYPWNIEISNCANFGNIYLTEQSEFVGVIVGTVQLKKASGILANTCEIYVGGAAQANVPVLQSGIKWLEDNVDNTATCIIPTAEQLASGWLAWQLQLNCGIQTWGQNISTEPKDAYPVIGGSVLYAEGSCTDDLSAATSFSNNPGVVTHKFTHHDAVPATCSKKGNHEYWYCSDCKTYFKEAICENAYTDDADAETGVWIEMIPHTLPIDFDENGVKYCSVCGHIEGEAPMLVADEASPFNGYYAFSKAGHLVWLHNQVQAYDAVTNPSPIESIKCYLANDISLKAVCHPADAANNVAEANWNPIGGENPFKGIFDGNGHTVSDLYINSSSSNLGLFGYVDGAEIKNVTVQGNVTGFYEEGNEQSGQYVGLVLGVGTTKSKLENCESRGSVTGCSYVGGIAGLIANNCFIASCTNRATVKNYPGTSGAYFGGIVGYGTGLSFCANYADITAEGSSVGGLVGYVFPDINNEGMSNCMNVGNVIGKQNVGGLAGECFAPQNTNNYSIGRVEATNQYAGLLVGKYGNDPSKAFANTYYVEEGLVVENGTATAGKYYGNGTISASAQAVHQADVASGKLASLLASVNSTWGQDLEQENTYPVLNGKTVYFSGSKLCNGHLLSEAYTNDQTKETATPAHSQEYEDGGFCTVCHESRELHGKGTANDPYLISNVAQLEYLRDQSNLGNGQITAHAKLVNDIDLAYASASSWIPVSKSNAFAGTFDGNGHCIKNLYSSFYQGGYVGLFGYVNGATIKNLTVEGVIESSCSNQGMIAGQSVGANFYNCVAKGRINTSGSADYVGGITGWVTRNSPSIPVVRSCASYVDIVSTGTFAGGIIGKSNHSIIMEACANYGNVTGKVNVGGLMGYTDPQSDSHITSCYVGSCEVRGTGSNVFLTCYEPSGNLSNFEKVFYSKDAKVFASADATEPEDLANRIAYGDYNTSSAFVGFTAEQIAGGEATYCMNNETTVLPVWTQDLKQANSQPELNGDAALHTVYKMGYLHGSNLPFFSNNQDFENTLHPEADNNGSHDEAYRYVPNRHGSRTHSATCSVCGYFVESQDCTFMDDFCIKCNYGVFDLFELADGEAYTLANGAEVGELNYARNFGGTNWTTWYVPFELKLTPELCQKYAFSRINNVHQYDDDNDGVADRTIVESFNQAEGVTLKANYPYLVRALTDADKKMTITLSDVELAKAESKHIDCMSVDHTYTFTGTYNEMGEGGTEANSPLSLFDYSDGNMWLNFHSLPAQRHYLVITPRDGSTPTLAPARVMLQVIGDETVTGIVNLYGRDKRSAETYDLSGRRVGSNQRGLLIKNGKKVLVK
ncbi:hypothetical protein [Prevotellamassilia timonensis]|uniref:hypothetical protein n=1 Tax=Prevotellamassilia timonensis TaxID=1852370 RepID=UPI0030793227